MNKIAIKPKTRAQWEDMRSTFLGGSEIATVLGINDWQTPYELWELKTGKVGKKPSNKAMNFGHLLEQSVSDQFETETGNRVIKSSADDTVYVHRDYPYLAGTPDRFYFPKEKDGRRVLECKTTSKEITELPEVWFVQIQFYLGLTDLNKGAIAWLSARFGFDFDHIDVEFDRELFEMLVQAGHHFWTEFVQKDTPPDPVSASDVQKMFKSHIQGKTLEVNDDIYNQHLRLKNLKESKKTIEGQINEAEEVIKLAYTDHEAMTYGGKIISTWKSSKPRMSFDKNSLKKDHPDIYQQYEKTGSPVRTFLIK